MYGGVLDNYNLLLFPLITVMYSFNPVILLMCSLDAFGSAVASLRDLLEM